MHVKAPIVRLHYLVQHDILTAFQVRMHKVQIRLRKFAFMHASIWLWIFDFMQPLEYIAHQPCWPEVCAAHDLLTWLKLMIHSYLSVAD